LATALRSGKNKDAVVYVGPMGCATGFYVLYRNISDNNAFFDIQSAFKTVLDYTVMPGNSAVECGNCYTLDLDAGKRVAMEYLDLISTKACLDEYPQ